MKIIAALFLMCFSLSAATEILIVADEMPAMEVLAAKLKAGAQANCTLVKQTEMPADLSRFPVMIVYIHKSIGEPAEKAFIDFAKSGGKLILLHHSISSGKRPNQYWFPFLKISLPTGDVSQGGYKYYEDITMDFVNLAPKHYITTHNVKYGKPVAYKSSDLGGDEKPYPAIELHETEVYLNQVFTGERTILFGVKFREEKSGKLYMQDRGGWYMKTEKGCVLYFMAGHSAKDFENPAYAQIIVNAVNYKP